MGDSISNTKNDILSLAGQDPDFKLIDIKGLESYHANAKNMFLYTDDNGNVNKTNLKIGGFEIKDHEPFNYTFEGSFNVATSDDDYVKQYITAEYDHKEPVFGYIGSGDEEYGGYEEYEGYLYNFIVTDASCFDPDYDQSEHLIGQSLKVPAYLLDTDYTGPEDALVFVDGKSGNVELPNNEFSGIISEERHYLNGYFIQSVPMSLKKSSKALLNGYDIVTSNVLLDTKNNIEDNINKNLKNFVKTDNNYQYTIPAEDGPGVLVNINTSVKNNNGCVNIEYSNERIHEADAEYIGSQKANCTLGSSIVSHVECVANGDNITSSSDLRIDTDNIVMSFKGNNHKSYVDYDVNICFDKDGILVDNNKVATTNYVDNRIENIDIPTSLPANGGNADTVDGKHADDFATADHTHDRFTSELVHFDGAIHICNVSEDVSGKVSGIYFSDSVEDDLYEPAFAFIREDGDDRLRVHSNYELKLSTGGNASGNITTEIDGPNIRVISNPDENDPDGNENNALTNTIQMNAENGVFINGIEVAVKSDIPDANVIGGNIIRDEDDYGITLKDDNNYSSIQLHNDGIFISSHGAQLIMDDGDFRFIKGNLIVDEDGGGNGDKVATEKFVEQYALSDSDIASISEIDALFDDLNIDYDPMES